MGEMRVRDVLDVTMRMLGRVQITVDEVDRIGIPVRDAIHNMKMCVEAIDRDEAEQAEEPEIELFAGGEKVGEVPAEENQDE